MAKAESGATVSRAPKAGARAKKRPERWTAAKQAAFLAELGRTANVAKSAKAAKVSDASVYRHRAKSAAFRAAWNEALREGYARLELTLLERAINGVKRPVFYGGNKIGDVIDFPDREALQLLQKHRESVMGRADVVIDGDEAVRRRMAARLAEMAARLPGPGGKMGAAPSGEAE